MSTYGDGWIACLGWGDSIDGAGSPAPDEMATQPWEWRDPTGEGEREALVEE